MFEIAVYWRPPPTRSIRQPGALSQVNVQALEGSTAMSDDMEARLQALDPGILAALLSKRAGSDADFCLWLGAQLAALSLRPLDPEVFRQRVQALLEPACRQREDPGCEIDEAALEELIGMADPFLQQGDGGNALAILMPVAAGLAGIWPQWSQWDETLHEFFPLLDGKIAQAVLMNGVSDESRDDFAVELSHWQVVIARYGIDDVFVTAITSAAQGWDEPGLADVMAGRGLLWPLTKTRDWPDAARLTAARLASLEAMGRMSEFLNLSKASGRFCDHAVMLAKQGLFKEALDVARREFHEAASVLCLAKTLVGMGQQEAAFGLADWGLSLRTSEAAGSKAVQTHSGQELAYWLREQAHRAVRPQLAVMAARSAFLGHLSRDNYRAAQDVCPASAWPALREALLAELIDADYAFDRIAILLDEDRIDDAMAVVDRGGCHHSPHDIALMQLTLIAATRQPAWAIRFAWTMAGPIIEDGRSSRYETAVQWLKIIISAHKTAGSTAAWRVCLESLIERHRRKHKLRAMLEALR